MSILVTGATGFIAQHIVAQLLEKKYNVLGTVRSQSKGDFLKSKFGSSFEFAIVPDISAENAFDEVLQSHPELKVIIHTAQPVTFTVNSPENDILLPAINGTKNIFAAIEKYASQVERVVYTSSNAAIGYAENIPYPTEKEDEDTWNPITYEEAIATGHGGYSGSKTFAEKIAWEASKKPGCNFKLTTVCPTYVFGPQLFDEYMAEELNLSNEIINVVVRCKGKTVPKCVGGYIDVKDVALAHIAGFEQDNAIDKRLYLVNGRFTEQSILEMVSKKYPQLGLPVGEPGSDEAYIKENTMIDNSKTKEILGFEFVGLEECVMGVADQIVKYMGV